MDSECAAILELVRTVRDDVRSELTSVRSEMAKLSTKIDTVASRPIVPRWLIGIVLAVATTVSSYVATQAVAHLVPNHTQQSK
jgi:hypothetical protein